MEELLQKLNSVERILIKVRSINFEILTSLAKQFKFLAPKITPEENTIFSKTLIPLINSVPNTTFLPVLGEKQKSKVSFKPILSEQIQKPFISILVKGVSKIKVLRYLTELHHLIKRLKNRAIQR